MGSYLGSVLETGIWYRSPSLRAPSNIFVCQFDHMYEPRHRKLLALGMASLVSTGRPEVLERVPNEIFNLWTDVLYELRESRDHTEDGEDGLVLDDKRLGHRIKLHPLGAFISTGT